MWTTGRPSHMSPTDCFSNAVVTGLVELCKRMSCLKERAYLAWARDTNSKMPKIGPPPLPYSLSPTLRQEKRAQRSTFWVQRPPDGGGGLPHKGAALEKFEASLESLSSLGFEGRNLVCPRNVAGMSRTPAIVQKVCAKKFVHSVSFPIPRTHRNACICFLRLLMVISGFRACVARN